MLNRFKSYWNVPRRIAYIFLLPSLLTLLVFSIIPIIGSIVVSFLNMDIFFSDVYFTGLKNFARAIADPRFWSAIKNTLVFAAVEMALQIVIGLLVANAICSTRWFDRMARSVFFIPVVCSMAAIGITWNILLDGNIGFIPYVLDKVFGIKNATFFRDPDMAMPTVIAMTVWKNFGYTMSILVVGIQSISNSYYEAASIDGASRTKQFFHITLPGIAPNLGFCVITNLIGSLQIFDQVYISTQGGPMHRTETLVLYIYKTGFANFYDLGYASAMSVLLLIVILCVSLPLYFRMFGVRKGE